MTKAEIKAELQKLIMGMHQGNKDARLNAYAERVHGLVEALETIVSDGECAEVTGGFTLSSAKDALAKFRGAKGGQNEN